MDKKKNCYNIQGEDIYLERAICYFFEKDNFMRLLYAAKQSRLENKKFYVGVYSDELLSMTGKKLPKGITEEDRLNLVKALDFVDGAMIINSLKNTDIEKTLEDTIIKDKYEKMTQNNNNTIQKKYEIGYASGGFDAFHIGHLKHIKEMQNECKTIILAANSDEMLTNGYKKKKVVNSEDIRQLILQHIKGVNIAIVTNEYDKLKAVEKIKDLCGSSFNAIFVGSDWKGDSRWDEFEKKFAELGIAVVFTDRPQESSEKFVSTSDIRNFRDGRVQIKKNPQHVYPWRKQIEENRAKIDKQEKGEI